MESMPKQLNIIFTNLSFTKQDNQKDTKNEVDAKNLPSRLYEISLPTERLSNAGEDESDWSTDQGDEKEGYDATHFIQHHSDNWHSDVW